MRAKNNVLFLLGIILLITIELFCAAFAYYTFADITASLLKIVILFINGIAIAVWFFSKSKYFAITLSLIFALLFIPYHLYWQQKYVSLQRNAQDIVHYLYKYNEQNGAFPDSLDANVFKDIALKKHFYYESYLEQDQEKGFHLWYYVGTKTTSHWYKTDTGWGYHPD